MSQQEGSRLLRYLQNNQINVGRAGKEFRAPWMSWDSVWLQGWSSKADFHLIPGTSGGIFHGTTGILQDLFHGNGCRDFNLGFSPWIPNLSQPLSQAQQSLCGFRSSSLPKCLSLSLSPLPILAGSQSRKPSQSSSESSPFPPPPQSSNSRIFLLLCSVGPGFWGRIDPFGKEFVLWLQSPIPALCSP